MCPTFVQRNGIVRMLALCRWPAAGCIDVQPGSSVQLEVHAVKGWGDAHVWCCAGGPLLARTPPPSIHRARAHVTPMQALTAGSPLSPSPLAMSQVVRPEILVPLSYAENSYGMLT